MILMLQLTKVISKLLKQIIFEIFRWIDSSNNTSDQCQNSIYILYFIYIHCTMNARNCAILKKGNLMRSKPNF